MPWVSRLLRGDRVWARALTSGVLVTGSDGRVDIIYRPGGKVYRASARNLGDDPAPQTLAEAEAEAAEGGPERPGEAPAVGGEARAPGKPLPGNGARRRGGVIPTGPVEGGKAGEARDPFIVYADGACTGNPGPCGLGVVLLDGSTRRELSEYLGVGTNNIAELTAIVRALEEAPRDRTVIVHSDSAYSLGLLGKGWKPKKNQELVARMRELAQGFRDLRLVKVEGHAGVVENERADQLARDAVTRRR